jgi:hypothetical protein
LRIGARRQKDDRGLFELLLRFESAAGFVTVNARHHHVQQDEIGFPHPDDLQGFVPIAGDADVEPLTLQHIDHHLEVGRRVVDDKNPASGQVNFQSFMPLVLPKKPDNRSACRGCRATP